MCRQTSWLLVMAVVIAAGLAVPLPARDLQARPPAARAPFNVVVAIADDWSWSHAGADGDPAVRTPVFDRLAGEGTRFTGGRGPSSLGALLDGRTPATGRDTVFLERERHAGTPFRLGDGMCHAMMQGQGRSGA